MASQKRKILNIIIGLVVFLVAARIALPFVVKWYLNNRVLNSMSDYRGHVDDVDLALIRGAYVIKDLVIVKIDGDVEEPFVDVPKIDLSVQWKEIWNGAIVGEVVATQPKLNFAFSSNEEDSQTGVEEDWTKVIEDLLPIRINRFAVVDGEVSLVGLFQETNTDFAFANTDLEVTNIQNTVSADDPDLPSTIKGSANATGYGGALTIDAKAMLLKQIPDFDYDIRFEQADLKEFNDLFEHFTGMTFESGKLSLYTEMAMNDGQFEGYFKPLLDKPVIFGWKEDNRNVGQWFKEFFSEGIKEIFKNRKEKQVATRIPLSGSLDDVNTKIWTTILNGLKNAYIKAFEPTLDGSIDFEEVQEGGESKPKKQAMKNKKNAQTAKS